MLSKCLLVIVIFAKASYQQLQETENVCQHELLPQSIVSLLEEASEKIIDSPKTKDYTSQIEQVKKEVVKLDEALFSTDTTGKKVTVTDTINQYATKFGSVLDSILSANADISKSLGSLKPEDSGEGIKKHLEEATENQREIASMVKNLTGMMDEIWKAVSTKEIVEKPLEESCAPSHIQNDTHQIVLELRDQLQHDSIWKEAMKALERSNKQLQRKIRKLKSHKFRPSDCSDIYAAGIRKSGQYEIYPNSCHCTPAVKVWCDMKTKGGGWTVILNRNNKEELVNFTRPWKDYQNGFGSSTGEYWLGNEYIHTLTSLRHYALLVEAQNRSGKKKWGLWKTFSVGSEDERYQLTVSDFSQSSTIARDILRSHNKEQFSTYDYDNDSSYGVNCADKFKGGWWYRKCFDFNPTGIMMDSDRRRSVSTAYFHHDRKPHKTLIPLKKVSIKIKPLYCATKSSYVTDHVKCTNMVVP